MQAAVIGGSGVAGSYTVEALRAEGHSVREISRGAGVDVYTGRGLDAALDGVDVVIDAHNSAAVRRATATDGFVTAARRIRSAAQRAGVQHIVLLSILGIDRVRGYGYYEAKLAQERATAEGTVPVTVLRATQFHEFPAQLLARLRLGRFAFVPHLRSQPVAARTVGEQLARLAAQRPRGIVELAGPQVHDIADLARRVVAAREARLRVVAITAPGKAARDMRGDALLATAATVISGPTFDEWLGSDDAQRVPLTRPSRATQAVPR